MLPLLSLLLGLCSAPPVASAAADPGLQALQQQLEQMRVRLDQLAEENRALRNHQEELDQKLSQLSESRAAAGSATAGAVPVPGVAPVPASPSGGSALPAAAPAAGPAGGVLPGAAAGGLRLWGYGEIYYTHPTHEPEQSQFDLARAVFGIGYRFDERTEFNSEYEVEHAVSSASDVGEFEVEQFYIDRRLSEAVTVRAGLLLMPFGFINEHHEPTNFYGVQRNFVETLIIPSTWREGGFNLHGDTAGGFSWNVGLTTGFDFSKWSFGAPDHPAYRNALELEDSGIAPLQATHQELALANAHDLSQYLALGYYGIPGVSLGAAISSGKAVPVPLAAPAVSSGDPRVTLWEAHARWAPARWDLTALYARGTVSNAAAANAANPGSPNPIPAAFYGYYLQGAYQAWEHGDYRLSPFARFERYSMGASYEGTAGPDYGQWPQNHDRVWTVGANFYLGPHVVLKGDYQWFEVNPGFSRFDLGLGVSF
ncbi:MAG: porin [Gammaproteobacteria bacterium]|nr:porin [Gammaproteobacteria bacterium]